jgi:uncharacterized membrane protein
MKFQIERILLFSDAVFAIAITLMIIEIKPPHIEHGVSFVQALKSFAEIMPSIFGTILSFYLIGHFWVRHHYIMKYLIAYDSKLIWLNISLLLSIAFIPFSTAFVFENMTAFSALPLLIYNLNYIVTTLISYKIYTHILNVKNNLCSEFPESELKQIKKEILFPIFVYTVVLILAFVNPSLAPIAYALLGFQNLFLKEKKIVLKK